MEMNSFKVVKNVITADMANFLYEYVKLKAAVVSFKREVDPQHWDGEWDGNYTSIQCPNTFTHYGLSLIHISEPTRLGMISYAVFCLKKKKDKK